MPKISREALNRINNLAASERKVHKEIDEWYSDNVYELTVDCKTEADVRQLFDQIQIRGH